MKELKIVNEEFEKFWNEHATATSGCSKGIAYFIFMKGAKVGMELDD